ncbi:MAG: hypothetical protein GXO29_00525 [Thermotogae bacterium]|nr:hypothetical protein [Thermotogota bacterium]
MGDCTEFKEHREVFKRVREALEDERNGRYREEFERALDLLVKSYDTRNHENRFVVGGAVEVLFCALLRALGFRCEWLRERRFDLRIDGRSFSIKSNFTGRGTLRLINVMGDGRVEWGEPTLFFIGGRGVFYADPCMDVRVKRESDALTIRAEEIFKAGGIWRINLKVPVKPKSSTRIRTASYDVARSVLEQIGSILLREHLPEG